MKRQLLCGLLLIALGMVVSKSIAMTKQQKCESDGGTWVWSSSAHTAGHCYTCLSRIAFASDVVTKATGEHVSSEFDALSKTIDPKTAEQKVREILVRNGVRSISRVDVKLEAGWTILVSLSDGGLVYRAAGNPLKGLSIAGVATVAIKEEGVK